MLKSKKIIIFVVMVSVLISLFSFGFSASALTPVYFKHAQPQVTENSCYLEISYDNNHYFLYVFGYCETNTQGVNENFSTSNYFVCQDIGNSSLAISYMVSASDGENSTSKLVGYWVNSDGDVWSAGTADDRIEFTIGPETSRANVRFYGIVDVPWLSSNWGASDYVFIYGSDSVLNQKLDSILGSIQSGQQAQTDSINSNANANTDKITQNDKENTQAIIDNQNQIQQNEKDETQNSGEQSVDDISSVIEDKSAGFISAMGGLVNAMSYNGTSCTWIFPALKLPAIEGLMPEYQLTSEQPIEFEYWVNQIPSNILLLIRSILTIGLIVFCFKELYSTISYVLTLKGGGNNE